MSFREYAFQDIIERLEKNPSGRLGVTLVLHKRELTPRKFELLKNPRYTELATRSLTATETAIHLARLVGDVSKEAATRGVQVSGLTALPAMFATLGHALCAQKRTIDVEIALDPITTILSTAEVEGFQPYENDIPEGTQQFCKWLSDSTLGVPKFNVTFHFIPPRLH